jgi:1-deoxyxylulose-5-phosphate synthase
VNRSIFAPLGRPLSRVVLGTSEMSLERQDDAFTVLEEWMELGGNVLDTAAIYGDGEAELVVGRFLEAGRRRTEVAIITKCCHPLGDGAPRVTPSAIHEDLAQSLSRLRTDSIDILMLHRDDVSVGVGPIIEALNGELEAGRIRSAGASNWTTRRLQEAAEFANGHGMAGFLSSSCQLSLAVQREPLASGCVSVHTPEDLAFHRRTMLPLFAWAALAGGYFRDGGSGDPDAERVYASAENRERWSRAAQLSKARGVSVPQVALAWVLNQGFPAFAVFSSKRVEHLRQTAQAAAIVLSDREVAWLDLEAGVSTP